MGDCNMKKFINMFLERNNMERGFGTANQAAREEIKTGRKEKKVFYIFITVALFTFLLALFFLSIHLLEPTGYVGYIESRAGYVTTVDLQLTRNVENWGGFYGLAIQVPGFTQILHKDISGGGIERSDVFFNCLYQNAQGGPEVFASTNPALNLDSSLISPASPSVLDEIINCTGKPYCANETYSETMTIYIGSTEISGIPSTHTYKYNGENTMFDVGILNVSGSIAFVAHLKDIQPGYNPDYIVNYQMLLPIPANTTERYYFYADPNDECPAGGLGSTINATVYGYVFNQSGTPIEDATVSVGGYSTQTDSLGFYNLSTLVLQGTFTHVAQKSGYLPNVSEITITFANNVIEKNATLHEETTITPGQQTVTPHIFGFVKDVAGAAISGAVIYMGNATVSSNISGEYSFYPTMLPGNNSIISIKENYENYYRILDISLNTTELNYNITMNLSNLYTYPTGPYTTQQEQVQPGQKTQQQIQQIVKETGKDYWISTKEINKQVRQNTFIEDSIEIYNFKKTDVTETFLVEGDITKIVSLDKSALSISPDSSGAVTVTISGTEPVGIYRGTIKITGTIEQDIPVKIEIVTMKLPVEALEMQIDLVKSVVAPGGTLKYNLNLNNLLNDQNYQIELKHLVLNINGTVVYLEQNETVEIRKSLTLLKEFQIPVDMPEGEYTVSAEAKYLDHFSSVTAPFIVAKPIYLYSFFGIPLWIIFIMISFVSFTSLSIFLYRRSTQKKKRYHLALKLDTLPKPGDRSVILGKIAERKETAYYNLDDLTTHAIVAGATGGGKSICAQVFVEEALSKGIAVIVFDPTAQWSGMLRKCDDKKMLSFYPRFGLKPNDAKAFPGSVRQVTNYLQAIDIKKYMNPGQIQIFTMNKMEPSQIDTFVAGVINNVFKSDPQEYPGLRLMLVFDEVHRLLPKFGGSGKGFLQIERACREFRKWGFGVMLVSQVLSDFVGEIKANINTEVQMRVAEENDLERIKERYGLDALKSLVRADVGTGMVQNAEYNKGLPYFINFRPILHNTRRLSDEVLEKYNQYNETIDDLEYQIDQLEKEKIDTFDLKMELKLVKDKLMTGNFTVVDIYLEGLKPRIEKQWESIGKKPTKREIKLIDVRELESSLSAAKKEREKWEKEHGVAKEEKKEVKIDIGNKIVRPITFDNGIMVSSLNELKDVLPNFDNSIFAIHVKEDKNDIADWASKEIDPALGQKLKPIRNKLEMIKIVEAFVKSGGKVEPDAKPEDKKDENKGEAKKPEDKKEEKKDEKPAEKKDKAAS
jgi:hypothetical protein